MNNETTTIWKPVKGYEGLYEVSNDGDVKSKKTGKILKKIKQQKHDYYTVSLCKNGKSTTTLVHRIVAEAFCDNPDNLPEVNHKDEDKHNNNESNLEYCTHNYNINYSSTGNSPISQYSTSGEFIARYESMNDILAVYPEYNRTNINMNLNCWTKTAYGCVWRYDNREY